MPEGCSFSLSWLTAMCLWERRLSEGSKWVNDQQLHWSTDWLGWKAERVGNNEWVSECMHMRGINTHETNSAHLSPHSAGLGARLRFWHVINCSQPQTHLNFNELNRQWFASKAISPSPLSPHPPFMLCRLSTSSEATQENVKLNFKESQSMSTEAYHFTQRKSFHPFIGCGSRD